MTIGAKVPKHVVIEELHVTILARADLPEKTVTAVRRVLGGRALARRLARETTEACRAVATPPSIQVRVSK